MVYRVASYWEELVCQHGVLEMSGIIGGIKFEEDRKMVAMKRRISQYLEAYQVAKRRKGEYTTVKDGVAATESRSILIDAVKVVRIQEKLIESPRGGITVSVDVSKHDNFA